MACDIVPAVVGAPRVEYERITPPNSFICADDYDIIKDLADYILYLDINDNEYKIYFHWKEDLFKITSLNITFLPKHVSIHVLLFVVLAESPLKK